jgi:hypothetical protein
MCARDDDKDDDDKDDDDDDDDDDGDNDDKEACVRAVDQRAAFATPFRGVAVGDAARLLARLSAPTPATRFSRGERSWVAVETELHIHREICMRRELRIQMNVTKALVPPKEQH